MTSEIAGDNGNTDERPLSGFRYQLPHLWLVFLLVLLLVAGCGEEPDAVQPPPEGFSFFDLGANSTLTPAVRKRLGEQLGSAAVTRRGIIDLEATRERLLQDHFAELERLNKALNYPPMERVEHDITRLTFRYAKQKDLPFGFVELVFWNQDSHPLFFAITAQTDGPAIVDQLEQKYGPPQTIAPKDGQGRILHWHEDRDVLIVSVLPNRLGEEEYHIAMYFVGNLERMLAHEQRAAAQRQEALKRAGEKAF
jgi:hypothetical protein